MPVSPFADDKPTYARARPAPGAERRAWICTPFIRRRGGLAWGRVDLHIEWVRDTRKTLETVRYPCARRRRPYAGRIWADLGGSGRLSVRSKRSGRHVLRLFGLRIRVIGRRYRRLITRNVWRMPAAAPACQPGGAPTKTGDSQHSQLRDRHLP
jgi:hypothetical protein